MQNLLILYNPYYKEDVIEQDVYKDSKGGDLEELFEESKQHKKDETLLEDLMEEIPSKNSNEFEIDSLFDKETVNLETNKNEEISLEEEIIPEKKKEVEERVDFSNKDSDLDDLFAEEITTTSVSEKVAEPVKTVEKDTFKEDDFLEEISSFKEERGISPSKPTSLLSDFELEETTSLPNTSSLQESPVKDSSENQSKPSSLKLSDLDKKVKII
jgi:hypothetical protein